MKRLAMAARYPGGKVRPEPREASPTEVRRLRDLALRGLRDAEWATPLGWLYAQGKISGPMYAAGRRWAREAVLYSNSFGVFPVRSAALERGHAHPADPDSPEGQEQAQRDRQAAERFCEAHAVLVASGTERFVRSLCERDEIPTWVEMLCIRLGLNRLATHYGLTDAEKHPTTDRHVGGSHPPD